MQVFKIVTIFFMLSFLTAPQISFSAKPLVEDKALIPAIVLDFELLGDKSIVSAKAQDVQFLEKFSKLFRQQIQQRSGFKVLDDEQTLARLEKESQRQYLHRCNGCELDIARQLGAEVVIVPWIFRMSLLLQVMNIEIRDVKTGKLIMKRPYDFRGNNEKAWDRTMRYTMKDIQGAAARMQE